MQERVRLLKRNVWKYDQPHQEHPPVWMQQERQRHHRQACDQQQTRLQRPQFDWNRGFVPSVDLVVFDVFVDLVEENETSEEHERCQALTIPNPGTDHSTQSRTTGADRHQYVLQQKPVRNERVQETYEPDHEAEQRHVRDDARQPCQQAEQYKCLLVPKLQHGIVVVPCERLAFLHVMLTVNVVVESHDGHGEQSKHYSRKQTRRPAVPAKEAETD